MAGLGSQRCASRGASALLATALLYATLGDVVRSEQQIPLSVVKLWASAFGGEIKSIAAKYSGSQLLQKFEAHLYPWGYKFGISDFGFDGSPLVYVGLPLYARVCICASEVDVAQYRACLMLPDDGEDLIIFGC
ncbi:hypothetical protein STEG23_019628 [Scotinomys teguina]